MFYRWSYLLESFKLLKTECYNRCLNRLPICRWQGRVGNDNGSYFEIRGDSRRSDPRSGGICPGRTVAVGPGARCIAAPTYVRWRGCPSRSARRTIKFHFCRANVFELAIKQWFSSPRDGQRGRAAALASSRFLFTHQRTGFAVYTLGSYLLAPASLLGPPLQRPHPRPLGRLTKQGGGYGYFGVRKYAECVCEGCSPVSTHGENPAALSSTKIICRDVHLREPGGFLPIEELACGVPHPALRGERPTIFKDT